MDFINHHKWLVDSNLLTDEMKDNVAMVALCLVEDVLDSATFMDFENNIVHYRILLEQDLAKNLDILKRYEDGEDLGFFEMRRLKKFLLKKQQNDESGLGYDLEKIANSFLKSYLNDKWQAKVEFKSVKDYDGKKDLWLHKMDYSESNE
jgi:hypothetical protein